MAYIDWWNRTGPVTLGERFGLNEISIARNTLSPTKSYTEDRIDMKPGGIVEPGVEYYGKAFKKEKSRISMIQELKKIKEGLLGHYENLVARSKHILTECRKKGLQPLKVMGRADR